MGSHTPQGMYFPALISSVPSNYFSKPWQQRQMSTSTGMVDKQTTRQRDTMALHLHTEIRGLIWAQRTISARQTCQFPTRYIFIRITVKIHVVNELNPYYSPLKKNGKAYHRYTCLYMYPCIDLIVKK